MLHLLCRQPGQSEPVLHLLCRQPDQSEPVLHLLCRQPDQSEPVFAQPLPLARRDGDTGQQKETIEQFRRNQYGARIRNNNRSGTGHLLVRKIVLKVFKDSD